MNMEWLTAILAIALVTGIAVLVIGIWMLLRR